MTYDDVRYKISLLSLSTDQTYQPIKDLRAFKNFSTGRPLVNWSPSCESVPTGLMAISRPQPWFETNGRAPQCAWFSAFAWIWGTTGYPRTQKTEEWYPRMRFNIWRHVRVHNSSGSDLESLRLDWRRDLFRLFVKHNRHKFLEDLPNRDQVSHRLR